MKKYHEVYRKKDIGLFQPGDIVKFGDKFIEIYSKRGIKDPCNICMFADIQKEHCQALNVDCDSKFYKELNYYEILFLEEDKGCD